MQPSSVITVSPSFTSHSANNLADIAARVVEEFRNENGGDEDDDIYNFTADDGNEFYIPVNGDLDGTRTEKMKENEEESDEDEEEEFEFAVVCKQFDSSSVSADEIFSNGEIIPRYPLFDRSLLLDDVPDFNQVAEKSETNSPSKPSPVVRLPLRKLFSEERDSPSCSSSEADDLDGITPGTYCIWKPKVESPGRCKKSNSTGNTSKRWKLRNLLHRSNSDRNFSTSKDASMVVFSPLTTTTKKKTEKVKKVENTAKVAVAEDDGEPAPVTYENNSAIKTSKSVKSRCRKHRRRRSRLLVFCAGTRYGFIEKLKGVK
ncbi:unnamed protein product [Lactuca saligna]|uniref:Uncharacterized protein n=1 Tax=Lactuca saligna TaxID=75948 RepID=A0AA35Z196_LACSI|nr:unnamed protein product [Lactuca saligna]